MTVVIGVVGTIASGKDVFADLVAARLAAVRFSFSQAIDKELKARKIAVSRPTQRQLANDLRALEGPGVWAKRIVEEMAFAEGYAVVEGFRNPLEVKEFYATFGKRFILVAVDAKVSTRFERAKARAKPGDYKTFEEFKEVDAKERGKGETFYGHNIDGCIALADYAVINNGSLDDLKRQADLVVEKARKL